MTRDLARPFLKPLRRTNRQLAGTLLVSPTKFITKGVAGRLMMSVGVPDCTADRPTRHSPAGAAVTSHTQHVLT
jgi:hypothetical protein